MLELCVFYDFLRSDLVMASLKMANKRQNMWQPQ
jgi:hypothetical protein